ncbi:hypothetical protein [Sphingomonas sp. UYP23]
MQNRTPVAREARPALPEFTPVPRKYRHDGWTPERQKVFIEALADTGSVSRAAAMCNMAQANAYTLRRAPGAEEFRRAWDAALDYGVQRLKDIAFERAIEGELVPVIAAGKVIGYRRKRNDALLMFCLRHYGQDAEGRCTTINYVSTRATAGASAGGGGGVGIGASAGATAGASAGGGAEAGAVAEATTTTMRTTVAGTPDLAAVAARGDALAASLEGFAGVTLDAQAHDAVMAALECLAARRRAAVAAQEQGGEAAAEAAEDDPDVAFLRVPQGGSEYRGTLLPSAACEEDALVEGIDPFEPHWSEHGGDLPLWVSELANGRAPSRAIVDAVAGDPGAGVAGDGVAAVKRPRRRRKGG